MFNSVDFNSTRQYIWYTIQGAKDLVDWGVTQSNRFHHGAVNMPWLCKTSTSSDAGRYNRLYLQDDELKDKQLEDPKTQTP